MGCIEYSPCPCYPGVGSGYIALRMSHMIRKIYKATFIRATGFSLHGVELICWVDKDLRDADPFALANIFSRNPRPYWKIVSSSGVAM